MNEELKLKCIEVLAMIQEDLENDINKRDGQPLTGETIAGMFGELSGIVSGLAGVVSKLIEEA